jgi:hypothetical protein
MTAHQFRRLALSLPGVEERSHMAHPDFRVGGKVFATLGYPDKNWGMIKLTPDQQRSLVRTYPGVFVPATGAWGRRGSTLVRLKSADTDVVEEAIRAGRATAGPRKKVPDSAPG